LAQQSEGLDFTDFFFAIGLELTTGAEFQKAVKTFRFDFVSVVAHDIGVVKLGEFFHDE
jgi:hypothetical protein